MLGEGLCLSIHLCRSLWRNCSAVSQKGMGRQGHFIPRQAVFCLWLRRGAKWHRVLDDVSLVLATP